MARWFIALFAAGLAASSLAAGGATAAPPPREGDFFVLAADLHVHGFPGDGALPAWDLRDEARRRGLDVIALTNHNHRLAGRLGRRFSSGEQFPLVLRGQEITAPRYHLIAIGVETRIPANLSTAAAIDAVHAQGGVAIAAHPGKEFWPAYDDRALAALDGTEVAHSAAVPDEKTRGELVEFARRARARNPRLASIGSTDYHQRQPMGAARTYIFSREYSEAGVIEAIRAGRTVAYDSTGAPYGDAGLAAIAERHRRDGRGDAGWRSMVDRVGTAAAVIALLGLILFRA